MMCQYISEIDQRIKAGEDPNVAIPLSLPDNLDEETLIEIYAYAVRHLTDENRKKICSMKLGELVHASR